MSTFNPDWRITTPWIEDEGCAFRAIKGTDPEVIANRVAFIEKTPRVRIRDYNSGVQFEWDEEGKHIVGERRQWEDFLNWASGDKGSGPNDKESREWCDKMLVLLGYTVKD